ncbi:MAG: B12-binding domain-containing radical SAM protein [Chloroflexi bacterium]|nr:B12-binding domain-containing radical SAM protein [Chloroflexota bacterium]
MKVLLIDPPGANKGLNAGLAYLAGALTATGRGEVFVLDLNNLAPGQLGDPNPPVPADAWLWELSQAIDQFEPELVGISVKTFTSKFAAEIVSAVKNNWPYLPVVVGGPHVTLDGARYVEETGAHIGVIGEADVTLPEICQALEQESSLEDIQGIVYLEDGMVIANPPRPNLRDLDALPFPNYDVFSSVRRNPSLLREYPLLTSRGCPFNCSYCSMPLLMGRRWRPRSVDDVIEELWWAVEQHNSTAFTIIDDNFTLDTKRAEAICDALIENGLSMPWSSQNGLRADRLTPELIAKMRRSGCYHVWVGIETADEQVFQSIEKGEKLEQVKAGVRALLSAGIEVGGFFIIGLPGSTRESDLKSFYLAQELGITAWWFNFVPYRFTRAGEWVQQNATLLRATEGVSQYGQAKIEPVFETPTYTREERIATFEEVHVRMGYFDRLVDPGAPWMARATRLITTVPRHGLGPSLSLARYFAMAVRERFSRTIRSIYRSSDSAETATTPKAALQSLAPSPIRPFEEDKCASSRTR